MRAALVVDNPLRDLPGMVLVALELARHGTTSVLVPMNLQERELWALGADLVQLNYLRRNNEDLARRLIASGAKVAVLDTEGGVLANFDGYAKVMADDAELRQRVSVLLTWGPTLAAHAVRAGWYRSDQVVVTGAPRFDYYSPDLRRTALRLSSYADAYPTPMILINGNFPVANPQFQSPEQEATMLIERYGFARDYILNAQRGQHDTMLALVALANRLAERFPSVTFVYRPHPFEKLETYRSLLAQRDNLHLVKLGTADGWILRAAAVIQRGCSTAIEAGLAGVPALSPAWMPTAIVMETAEAVSVQCATEADLCTALESILAGHFSVPETVVTSLDGVIRDWFHAVDGQAHRRVVQQLLRCLAAPASRRGLTDYAGRLYGLYRRSRIGITERVGQALRPVAPKWLEGSPRFNDDAWLSSEKFFDEQVVSDQINCLVATLRENDRSTLPALDVRRADDRRDYRTPYQGRSVVVAPRSATSARSMRAPDSAEPSRFDSIAHGAVQ